jgi:hypothetical protein
MSWILLITLWSPGGDYVGKIPVEVPSKAVCQAALKELPKSHDEGMIPMKVKGLCVTIDHWTGKKPMPDVPLSF